MRENELPRSLGSVVKCVALAAVAAAGCGSVEKKPGVAIENAASSLATTVCPKAYQCCTATQLMGNDMAGTDEPSCEASTMQAYAQQVESINDSERKGRARYDGAALETCLANVRSMSCESLNQTYHLRGVPGCASFVEPLVNEGGACGPDFECKTGWCKHHPNSLDDGVCTVPPAEGQACPDDRCAGDLFCDQDTVTCKAPTPPTDACFYSSGCSVGGTGGPLSWAALALGLAAAAAVARARAHARSASRVRARAGDRAAI